MICAECGRAEVEVGSACPECGSLAVSVAPDLLDSVLSLPAEPVPDDADGDADAFVPLTVEPRDVPSSLDEIPPGDVAPRSDGPAPVDAPLEERVDEPMVPAAVHEASIPATDPLPRRRPLAAVAPQWGPRDHPPAVLAPPPPHPLDAPPARVRQPSGTGLPPAVTPVPIPVGGPVQAAPAATAPSLPTAVPEASIPERPNHPRVRRWFGRGTSEEPEAPPVETAPDAGEPAPEGPFVGAPEGLLDGVTREPDLGPGVHDPAGVEAAMSRMSSGARRNGLAPMAVVATLLDDGEKAEAAVQGEYQHRPAVVVLTDRRVVVANDRRWAPDVRTFAFDPDLRVHGWQDERRATLVFELDRVGVVVDAISDRPLARDLAQRIRGRCAGEPPGV